MFSVSNKPNEKIHIIINRMSENFAYLLDIIPLSFLESIFQDFLWCPQLAQENCQKNKRTSFVGMGFDGNALSCPFLLLNLEHGRLHDEVQSGCK